jgi:predicted Abi (CAAX) family protease
MEEAVRVRTNARKKRGGAGLWLLYMLGRTMQVAGLLITLIAATQFFGTKSTIAMLRMMLAGVLVFLPGWLVVRHVERTQKGA